MSALFGLVRSALMGSSRATAEMQAAILAESTLEAMGVVAPLADGDAADLDDGRFHIHSTIGRDAGGVTNGYLVPYVLATTVTWHDGTRAQAVTLRTIRLGPPR